MMNAQQIEAEHEALQAKRDTIVAQMDAIEADSAAYDELDTALTDVDLLIEALEPDVDAIECRGADVYNAATNVFRENTAHALHEGAFNGHFRTFRAFVESELLATLRLTDVPLHWIDFDAIEADLNAEGTYIVVEGDRPGVYIFALDY